MKSNIFTILIFILFNSYSQANSLKQHFSQLSVEGIQYSDSQNLLNRSGYHAIGGNNLTAEKYAQNVYIKASNTEANDQFGGAIALSGNTLVVAAKFEDSDGSSQSNNSAFSAGAVYIFIRVNDVWQQQAYLKSENIEDQDSFGTSVAISGDTIVVGAPTEDGDSSSAMGAYNNNVSNAGAAYVFVRNGTSWSQQAYLKASNADTGISDNFGQAVSISGDTVVVGAFGEASSATGVNSNQALNNALNAGAAYVFTRSSTTWSQQAYLKASNTQTGDNFGISVAISNNTIVVAARSEDGDDSGTQNSSGAVYIFQRNGTSWSQQALLRADNAGSGDVFGFSLGISGNTIVVGARGEKSTSTGINFADNDNGSAVGAVYIFQRSGLTWAQQARIKPSFTNNSDFFGQSVAISGETLVVGAIGESSDATGINGEADNNNSSGSGAAYVFTRRNGIWQQHSFIKASNSDDNWKTGSSVAVFGDLVVTGAREESSDAIGINGDQNNTNASDSGAVYVFNDISLSKRQFDINLAIPDDDSNGLTIDLDLNGLFNENILNLEIALDINHNAIGDLSIEIIAPNNIAHLAIMSRTGMTSTGLSTFGAESRLVGVYHFSDLAGEDLWQSALGVANGELINPNRYRTSTKGNNFSQYGGCTTRLNGAFAGLTPTQSNGIWTLKISDNANAITGFINSVEIITRQEISEVIFSDGFEPSASTLKGTAVPVFAAFPDITASDVPGDCIKAQFDYTGTGLSDYVTTFTNSVTPGITDVNYQIKRNNGTLTDTEELITFSAISSNPVVTSGGDFDGDGIDDIILQTDVNFADYFIRRSSRPNDLPVFFNGGPIQAGRSIDLQIGDYNGDGLDDIGFFRSDFNINEQSMFFGFNIASGEQLLFNYSLNSGIASDFKPSGGFDHNGDGSADLLLLNKQPNDMYLTLVYDGKTGNLLFDSTGLALTTPVRSVSGIYLDNGNSGISTIFGDESGGAVTYQFFDENNNLAFSSETISTLIQDILLSGDYNGDGKDDAGVWRPNSDGLGNRFIITPTNGDPIIEYLPSSVSNVDYPIANTRIR